MSLRSISHALIKEETMPYDKSLDAELFKKIQDFGDTRISVAVYSYNGGEKKLQITRENKIQDEEWQLTELSRLSKTEIGEIVPVSNEAIGRM